MDPKAEDLLVWGEALDIEILKTLPKLEALQVYRIRPRDLPKVQALGDLPGDIEAGHDLAQSVCAACHDIGGQPPEGLIFQGDPPPFRLVADDPAVTPLSLTVFLRTPHQNMPNIMLSRQETDDVIAYILSLRD